MQADKVWKRGNHAFEMLELNEDRKLYLSLCV